MSRPIRFRGWDKKQKKMFYVPVWFFSLNVVGLGMGEDSHHLGTDYCEPMQFTGLLDKNGKEIYEGDIIERASTKGIDDSSDYRPSMRSWVEWRTDWKEIPGFYLVIGSPDNEEDRPSIYGLGKASEYLEIIGNIYENPELLK